MLWKVVALACLAAVFGQSTTGSAASMESLQNVTILYEEQGSDGTGKSAVKVAEPSMPKAKPPNINAGFVPLQYFRDGTDAKTLDCKAQGIPKVSFEWRHNGRKIIDQPGVVRVREGKLEILTPGDNQIGFYQCFAKNDHGVSMSQIVEFQKAGLNSYPTLPVHNAGSFDAGEHVVLTCRQQPASVPTAVYDWFKQLDIKRSEIITTGGRIIIDQTGDLHFVNVLPEDQLDIGMTYNCTLYNVVAMTRVYGSPTALKINNVSPIPPRSPSVYWFTEPERAVALLGKSITLQCIPDGYPIPGIEWRKQGGELPPGRHMIDSNKYTLQLLNVTENDEGTYICSAVHGNQRADQSIFVDVKSKPIWVEKLKSVTLTNGKTAKFECVARSARNERDNVVVQWFKNGEPITANTKKIRIEGTKLTVHDILKPYDLMNIQCNVSNSIGYQMADSFLNVIVPTKLSVPPKDKVLEPGKVVEVPIVAEADPLYAHHLNYSWAKDGRPVSRNSSQPVYQDVANKLIINATDFGPSSKFRTLLGNYSCVITMGLESGEGNLMVFSHISSKDDKAIVVQAGADLWWIAIVIAVIVLILIIILICCLLYRNRGGTYPVDEKERRAGHDPEKELADSGFQDLTRADAPEEKKPYGNPDQVSLTNDLPIGGDTDSLDEYGEPDSSKFNEDGSFIGYYGGKKGREANQSQV